MKYKNKRICSCLLAATTLCTAIPVNTFAAYPQEAMQVSTQTLIGFDTLPNEISHQTIELGIDDDVEKYATLPSTLVVYVTPITSDTNAGIATLDIPREDKTETIENVTWNGKQTKTNGKTETWIYTPDLPKGYTVMEDVTLPEIEVTAKRTDVSDAKPLNTQKSVTVSTSDDFLREIQQGNKQIFVNGKIVLRTDDDSDGRMPPIYFKEGTEIIGASSDAKIVFSNPMQLTGNHVSFKNIEMHFESSNALNSVPHREIFLAGYSLTLDNVHTYLKGGNGSLGDIGGTEKELLPTVYAGGYRNTTNMGNHASLTINNANEHTLFQGIYLAHDSENGVYTAYNKQATLRMGKRTNVRDGIHAEGSEEALIEIKGTISDTASSTKFVGDENTTLRLEDMQLSSANLQNIGTVTLLGQAKLIPQSSRFENISVPQGTTLDLSNAGNVIINGNFDGGGTVILDKDNSLNIKGTATGQTTLATWNSYLVVGNTYIYTTKGDATFQLADNLQDRFELQKNGNNWVVYQQYDDVVELGSVIVRSTPNAVDLNDIEIDEFGATYKKEPLEIICKDKKDNIISDKQAKEYFLLADTTGIKTEYWTNDTHNDKTDGSSYITLTFDDNTPSNKYYLQVPENQKEGSYTLLILSESNLIPEDRTLSVKELKDIVANKVLAEIPLTFYRTGSSSGATAIEDKHISDISNQIYTGQAITPNITVTVGNQTLTNGKDYVVHYQNNTNVGTATVEIIGIGSYTGTVKKNFEIVKSDANFTLTANKTTFTYGEEIQFAFQEQAKPTTYARTTEKNHVSFYCDNQLLGTAIVDNDGRANLTYRTEDRKIPIGTSKISVVFGGSDTLNPNTQPVALLDITLKKHAIDLKTQVSSVSLKDFVYDGVTKRTDVQSVVLTNGSILPVTGKADLPNTAVGAYNNATLVSLSPNGSEADWYEFASVAGISVRVSPAVNIVQGSVHAPITIEKVIKWGESGHISLADILPKDIPVNDAKYTLSASSGNVVSATLQGAQLHYTTKNPGKETIVVTVETDQYQPFTITIHFTVTYKDPVVLGLIAPNQVYNGKPYTGWRMKHPVTQYTVHYYDVTEQKALSTAPKDAGNYSITVSFENDTQIGTETQNFMIEPKEVHLRAIDRQIKVGNAVPSLDKPQFGTDYQFETGYEPLAGESIGEIHMSYDNTPNTTQVGKQQILITVVNNNHNYDTILTPGTLTINPNESGSSSSSNNSRPANKPNKNPPVSQSIPEVKPNNNGVSSVTTQSIEDAIQAARSQNNKDMTIVVPVVTENSDTLTVSLPEKALDSLISANAKLELSADNAVNISFHAQTLAQITKNNASGDLMVHVQKQTQIPQQARQVVGTRPVYDIKLSLYADGKETNISNLDGKLVTIGIPYKPASGEIPTNLRAVYIRDDGMMQWIDASYYDAKKGVVTFATDHFSLYAIGYAPNNTSPFSDITGHWAEKDILFATQRGIFSGTDHTHFTPNGQMTRGMFVTVLGRLAGAPHATANNITFIDVPLDAYYAPYVVWATENGIASGVCANTFAPNRPITRQEMAVMMYHFANQQGYTLPIHHQKATFSDQSQIRGWATDAVYTMQQAGILFGKQNNRFDPLGTATRAEVAAVLRRLTEQM